MADTNIVSGFHSLSNFYHPGWTEQFLAELEAILEHMYNDKTVQAMKNFRSDLENHLYIHKNPHDFSIEGSNNLMIQQMYEIYRTIGHIGTVENMLDKIADKIIVATDKEMALGIAEDRAINVNHWRDLFLMHCSRQTAHGNLFEMFTGIQPVNKEISFCFDCIFPENWDIYQKEGYTPSEWNPSNGTLHLELSYDTSANLNKTTNQILKIQRLVSYCLLYVSNNSIILEFHNPDGSTDFTSIPFSRRPEGYSSLIIAYNPKQIILRDVLNTQIFTKPVQHFFTGKPYSFHILAPLQQIGNPIGLRTVEYYGSTMTEHEQTFFLN